MALSKEDWTIRHNGATSRLVRDAVVLALLGKSVLCVFSTQRVATSFGWGRARGYVLRDIGIASHVRALKAAASIDFLNTGGRIVFGGTSAPRDGFDVVIEDVSIARDKATRGPAATHTWQEQTVTWFVAVPIEG